MSTPAKRSGACSFERVVGAEKDWFLPLSVVVVAEVEPPESTWANVIRRRSDVGVWTKRSGNTGSQPILDPFLMSQAQNPESPQTAGLAGLSSTPFRTEDGRSLHLDLTTSTTNYNALVVGASGRNLVASKLLVDVLVEGGVVRIIDLNRDFSRQVEVLGGKVHRLASPVSLDPFQFLEDEAAFEDAFGFLSPLLLGLAFPGVSRELIPACEHAWVGEALRSVWREHQHNGSVAQVCAFLKAAPDARANWLAQALADFDAGGRYADWFAKSEPIDLTSEFVSFDLSSLSEDPRVVSAVLHSLLYRLQHEAYARNRQQKKLIVLPGVDESAYSLVSPGVVEMAFRRLRRFRGAAVATLGSFRVMETNPVARAVFENAAWVFATKLAEGDTLEGKYAGRIFNGEIRHEVLGLRNTKEQVSVFLTSDAWRGTLLLETAWVCQEGATLAKLPPL